MAIQGKTGRVRQSASREENSRRRTAPYFAVALLSLASIATTAPATAATRQLVPQTEAARYGLVREWFAQIPVDANRSRVTSWHIYYDHLYCVTDSGLVTAIKADTGATLWTKQIGQPDSMAFGPTANEKYIGVISGSRLFLLHRNTGRLKWSRSLGSAPSSGPALSEKYAYVALVTGRIEGYLLEDPATQPWYYQSSGRTHLRPTITGDVVSWPTATGNLYVSRAEDPGVLFRLESNEEIVTSPAEQAPYLYIASLDGYLYCMNETNGRQAWRYSTGYPIASSPAIVGEYAYVASLEPVLHAMNAVTGQPLWRAPGASHFAAQGKTRTYASDQYGNLLILDAKTGRPFGRIRTSEGNFTLVNDQSDRIYLANEGGLIQCFRELDAEQATRYRQPTWLKPAEATDADAAQPPAAGQAPAAAPAAAPRADEPADEAGDEPMDEPADEPAAGDSPFGDF